LSSSCFERFSKRSSAFRKKHIYFALFKAVARYEKCNETTLMRKTCEPLHFRPKMAYTRVIAKNEYRPFVTFLLQLHFQLERKNCCQYRKILMGDFKCAPSLFSQLQKEKQARSKKKNCNWPTFKAVTWLRAFLKLSTGVKMRIYTQTVCLSLRRCFKYFELQWWSVQLHTQELCGRPLKKGGPVSKRILEKSSDDC